MTEFRPWCKAEGCQVKPTWWVRDVDGTQLGHYCKRHAKQRVDAINELQARWPKVRPIEPDARAAQIEEGAK